MTLQQHHSLPLLELRSQDQGQLTGMAAVFGGIDSYGDSIRAGAFAASIAHHKARGTMPVMLWSHKTDSPIGRWTSMIEQARGLQVVGQLNLKTTLGREAYESTLAGDMTGLSIGYQYESDGFEVVDGVRYLSEISLHEVSVVALPADSDARISSVKARGRKPTTRSELQAVLEQSGFSRREAREIVARGCSSLLVEPDPSIEILTAIKAATNIWRSL